MISESAIIVAVIPIEESCRRIRKYAHELARPSAPLVDMLAFLENAQALELEATALRRTVSRELKNNATLPEKC